MAVEREPETEASNDSVISDPNRARPRTTCERLAFAYEARLASDLATQRNLVNSAKRAGLMTEAEPYGGSDAKTPSPPDLFFQLRRLCVDLWRGLSFEVENRASPGG
jgi:hypothetical protein